MRMNCGMRIVTSLFCAAAAWGSLTYVGVAQTPPTVPAQQPTRPAPPTRDPHTPGYVSAMQLPDGTVPSANADGNFIIGPTHTPAPEMTAQDLTNGSVVEFTMSSADSKYYPGIARDKGTFGTPDPSDRQSW